MGPDCLFVKCYESALLLTDLKLCRSSRDPYIFQRCTVKWNCMKYIQLGHRVVRSEWSASESQWHVTVEVIESGTIIHDYCDVLLSATGVLKYSLTKTKCENSC
jgi:hypothetical protein